MISAIVSKLRFTLFRQVQNDFLPAESKSSFLKAYFFFPDSIKYFILVFIIRRKLASALSPQTSLRSPQERPDRPYLPLRKEHTRLEQNKLKLWLLPAAFEFEGQDRILSSKVGNRFLNIGDVKELSHCWYSIIGIPILLHWRELSKGMTTSGWRGGDNRTSFECCLSEEALGWDYLI